MSINQSVNPVFPRALLKFLRYKKVFFRECLLITSQALTIYKRCLHGGKITMLYLNRLLDSMVMRSLSYEYWKHVNQLFFCFADWKETSRFNFFQLFLPVPDSYFIIFSEGTSRKLLFLSWVFLKIVF